MIVIGEDSSIAERARYVLREYNPLPRFAWDYRFRPRAACNGGWRKCRQIGVTALEAVEPDLPVPDGCELAAQQRRRSTMLGRRFEGIDNADARVRLECWDQVMEQGIGL